MAENIKIGIDVDDGGSTKKLVKDAKELQGAYNSVANTANKLGGVKATTAPNTTKAIKDNSRPSSDLSDYSQAKGLGGMTGASARDFAKESQGLGGLVRVYATFAANLFAVTAAFTALKEAASTESMVRGLDMLGAASGKNLGTLSKQLVATTGGAISLRDAMTAVAQASSAGLGNKQINDIAVVAAKASNALGISMTDAISRLSRGISKIEPELLDEIGLFVKVDDATNKYALSVGKTVGSLSDFEKRQAFANAVLEQGKEKFAAIESAPNPYDKLLASITNLATAGLELVNKVLAPIIKVLAESPMALAAVFATIATVLLKQAIPAIGQFREGMRKSADDALKSAEAFKDSFGDRFQGRLEARFKLPDLQAEVKKFEASLGNIKLPAQLAKGGVGKLLSATEEDTGALKAAEKALKLREQQIETGMKGTKAMSEAQKAAAKQEYDDIQKVIALYKKKLELAKANEAALDVANKPLGRLDPERLAQKRYEKLRMDASSASAVSAAADTAQITGVRDAWRELNTTIEKEGITGLSKYTTLAKGGLAAVGSRIMGLASAFSDVILVGELVIAVIAGIDSVLSQAAKEQEEYNTKIDATHEAVKGVNTTFDLYTQKRKSAFSIEGITAFNTALAGVSTAFADQLTALEAFRKASGIWDVIKDTVSGMWGGSNLQKAKKSAQESVNAVLKSLEFSSGKGKAIVDIAGAIGIDPSKIDDVNALEEAISKLNEADLGKLSEQFKKVEESEQFTTNAAKAFIESLTAVDKVVDQMIQANAFTDLQGKLGVELVNAAQKFAQALQDPLKALLDIEALAKDPKALAVLGNVNIEEIFKATKAIKDLNEAESELIKATKSKAEQTSTGNVNLGNAMDTSGFGAQIQDQAQQVADANYNEAVIKLGLLKAEAQKFAQAQANLVQIITDEGFKRVMLGLKLAQEQAGITVERARASIASSAGLDTSQKEYSLKMQEISVQERLIRASYDAQLATIDNTDKLNKLTATQQILAAEALRAKGGTPDEVKANAKLADSMTKAAQQTLNVLLGKQMLKEKKSEADVEKEFGKPATTLAKSALQAEKIPGLQLQGQLAKLGGDAVVAEIERINKAKEYQLKLSLEQNAVEKDRINIQLDLLNTAGQLNSYGSNTLINSKLVVQQRLLEQDTAAKRTQLEAQLEKIEREKKSATDESYVAQKALLQNKLTNLTLDEAAKNLALELNAIRDRGAAKQADLAAAQAAESERIKLNNSYEEAKIANLQRQIDIKLQLGLIDEQIAIRAKGQLDLQSQKIKFEQEEQRIKADILAKEAALTTAKNVVKALPSAEDGMTVEQSAALDQATTAQANAQAQLNNANLALEINTKSNNLTVDAIKANTELNAKLAEQREHLASIGSVTQNLSDVFGKFGKSLGGVISAFDSMADGQKKRADREKSIVAQLKTGAITEEQAAEQRQKNTVQEINDQARVAGAVKGLFKEKTAAYKIFHALEMGMKLASLAMEVKTSMAKISVWWGEVAAKAATEAGKTAWEGMGFFARLPFYVGSIYGSTIGQLGPIAGPVVATGLIAMLLSLVGGGGKAKMPGGFSAKAQQEVQGTGQMYDESGKLVTRAGGALGDSKKLADSVKTSIDTLSKKVFGIFDTDNSKLLTALRGIQENTAKTAIALLQGSTGLFGGENPFGFREGTSKGTLGFKKTTSSIVDEGIQVEGTLNALAAGFGEFNQYINTAVTKSSWWGLSKSTTFDNDIKALKETAPQAVEALMKVFNDVRTVLLEASKFIYGEGSAAVDKIITETEIKLKASSKGLSATEFADKLLAEVTVQLNAVAEKAFPELAGFRRLGEEMWQTVARLMKDYQTISDGFSMIGLSAKNLTGTLKEVVTDLDGMVTGVNTILLDTSQGLTAIATLQQMLIEAAGGMDNLTGGMQTIFDEFFTDTKRFNLSFSRMNQLFKDAGLQLPKTKDEYLRLIETTTDVDTLGFLIRYSGDYIDLLGLQNSAMSETISNLEDTVSSFQDFAKNIKTFREGLYLGSASTATPLEKLGFARTRFDELYGKALGGDKEAMSQLTGAAQTLLDLGRTVYASSDQYQSLFEYVNTMLGTAETKALDTASIAERQLEYAKGTVDLLDNIDTNIAAIAGGTPVTAHAMGGLASGWALVGERGPELVNFSNPAQVYTADQTAGMFAPNNNMGAAIGAMITEIQQLRQEVAQLRNDQQKQTGDIIISNYDAHQKSSDEIATAVVNTSKDNEWANRSKSEIK